MRHFLLTRCVLFYALVLASATVVSDAHFVGKAAYAKAKLKLPIGDNGRIAIRTKFFDETIRMAMYENPTHVNWQIVLLGSGMDTRMLSDGKSARVNQDGV